MRLLRFVAVAFMVTVGVASLGCGEQASEPATKPAADTDTASTSAPAETPSETAPKAETAATGTTPVSLTISGMA